MSYLLSLDDTDSRFGHCTTHLGYLIVSELVRIGCTFSAYPRLVRLNPNIPFKTRGNAAVCIEFEANSNGLRDEAFRTAERLLEAEADVVNGANAALVMTSKASDDLAFFRQIYQRAVSNVVNYKAVIRAVSERGIRHKLLGNGMGIVGATASLGFSCEVDDHTYELIAYRRPENCGRPRAVEPESVKEMEAETFPHTFNSYDYESGRVLIAPSGPDPVLAGVRGDSPRTVLEAFKSIRTGEETLGHVIYATNQCTDAHLTSRLSTPLSAYSAGWLEGVVVSTHPSEGGHLALHLRAAEDSSTATCMVYEPSGDLRRVARLLKPGDLIRVSGGVRRASSKNPVVVNVERIDVLEVSHEPVKSAPRCAACGSGMKSEGRGKGYQCRKCGRKSAAPTRARRAPKPATQRISPGAYLPSPRAQRHLTKQLIRYGREQTGMQALVGGWVEPPSTPRLGLPRSSSARQRLEKLKIKSAPNAVGGEARHNRSQPL